MSSEGPKNIGENVIQGDIYMKDVSNKFSK